ncbi:MAG: sulfatase-like hydrolase/transferase, partial [Desulfobacterales bacterium]
VYLFVAIRSQLGGEISAGESPGFAFLGELLLILMVLATGYLFAISGLQFLWLRSSTISHAAALKITTGFQLLGMGILAPALLIGSTALISVTAFLVLASILGQGFLALWIHQMHKKDIPYQLGQRESHVLLFLVFIFLVNAIVAQLDPSWHRLKEFILLNSSLEIFMQKLVPGLFAGVMGLWFGIATLAIISLSAFLQVRFEAKSVLKGILFFLPFILLCGFYNSITLSALSVAIEWQVSKLNLRPAIFALAILLSAVSGAFLSSAYARILSYLPANQKRCRVGLVCVAMGVSFFYPLFWLLTARPYRRFIWILMLLSVVLMCGLLNFLLLYGDLFNPWFTAFSYLKSILLKISTLISAGTLVLVIEEVTSSESVSSPRIGKRWAILAIVLLIGFIPFALLNHYPRAKATLLQYSDLTRVEAAYARELAGMLELDQWVRLGQNPALNQQPHPWPQPWKLQKVRPSLLPKDFNLMVIVVDALRGDAFHSAGYRRNLTPFLDKWAKEETISFRRAYSQGGGSFAAFPFLVAGRSRFSLYGPDLYQENLYLKIAEAEGIQHYMVMKNFGPRAIFPPDHPVTELTIPRAVSDRRTAAADEVFDSARQAIAQIKADERFLCFLHLMDVHNDLWKKPGGIDFGDAPRDVYDNNLSYLDGAFEGFIAWLKTHHIYDKTVILFTSDHGEQFWEHGASLHGHTLYEEEIRIPAILLIHGIQRRFEDVPVIAADMAPTIAELAGYAVDPPYDDPHMGISLVPLILEDERTPYLQRDIVGRASFKRRYFLYRNWQWKFVYLAELDLIQLFNVADDPLEQENLIEEKPGLAAELEQQLLDYLKRVEGKTYRPLLRHYRSDTEHFAPNPQD